ncbi:MAG: DUF4124 domain-containing protein [Pseudomonadota bacterium]
MSYFLAAMVVLLFVFSEHTQAQVYRWVDENGITHFSETPPEESAVEKQKLSATNPSSSSNIRPAPITQREGRMYCGTYQLMNTKGDQRILLANIRPNLLHWENHLKTKVEAHKNLLRRQREINTSPNKSGDLSRAIARAKQDVAEQVCLFEWAKQQSAEFEPVRQEYLAELARVQQEYDDIQNECGEKPEAQGWTDDEAAKAWVTCSSRRISRHNKKLRELKRLKALQSSLE